MTEKHAARLALRADRAVAAWTPERALRQECTLVGCLSAIISLLSLAYCLHQKLLLLPGDAVAHLHIARRITDSINPGFRQLGSVWLPLPHLLLLPFVQKLGWWQSGLAGAPPSMLAYIFATAGLYRLARYWLVPRGAVIAAAFFALNPGLLYLQTTAMNEPLFLAEMIWAAVLLTAYTRAVKQESSSSKNNKVAITVTDVNTRKTATDRRIQRLLLSLALVLAAAVFTRYDGWVYAALAWSVAAWVAFHTGSLHRPSGGAFVLFTAIVLAAPLFWLAYNAKQFHDPLDFMRGPYSARAIEIKTTPPGAPHYPGWHRYGVAAHYFLKASELGAVPAPAGNLLLALALAGAATAVVRRQARAVFLLLWFPWPFYAYSIAYGSVPIFIPPWPPYSWYNTRYGMELLPAFALGLAFVSDAALAALKRRLPQSPPFALAAVLILITLNAIALLRARPLVLAEFIANSRTRIPFESALARALASLPHRGRILMSTSDHVGALQQAGIPLVRTINDTDYFAWTAALQRPAAVAPFVAAIDGDAVAQAVSAHPQGLTLLDVICSTGQPCARLYTSGVAAPSSGSISTK